MSAENAAFIRRWFEEVWNKKRVDAIDDMASPDLVGHGQAQHGFDMGRDQFKQFARDVIAAFPDIHVNIQVIVSEGDLVAARWVATMTHKAPYIGIAATGRTVNISGTSIARIANAKVVEGWDNWDQLALLVQIGAVPAAAFAA
jgi:steroid delta-isomerase-like uncharacterized protein